MMLQLLHAVLNADTEQVPGCDVTAPACCMNADTKQVPGCDVTVPACCMHVYRGQYINIPPLSFMT
jgi:hypothetical protein